MVMLRVEVSEVMLMAGRVDVAVRVVPSVVVVEASTASMVDVRVWIMIDVLVEIGVGVKLVFVVLPETV